jgi:hypothetical protein
VELGRTLTRRVLLLVLLLDRAVAAKQLPPAVPLLFRKDGRVKSSEQEGRACLGATRNAHQ